MKTETEIEKELTTQTRCEINLGTRMWHKDLAQGFGTRIWHKDVAQGFGTRIWHIVLNELPRNLYSFSTRYLSNSLANGTNAIKWAIAISLKCLFCNEKPDISARCEQLCSIAQ